MGMEDAQKAVLKIRDRDGRIWTVAAALSKLYPEGEPTHPGRTLIEGEGSSLVDFKVVVY